MKKILNYIGNPRKIYVLLMFFLIITKSLSVIYLKILGNYVGYYTCGLGRYEAIAIDFYAIPLILVSLFVFVPVWDLYKNSKFKICFFVIASTVIIFLANSSFAITKSAILQTWHNIVIAEKRFDIEYEEKIPEEFSEGKNTIIYIYSNENNSDDFINYIVDIQPVKIYRIEYENAEEFIEQNGILTLPAVVINREGEMYIITGEKAITEQLGVILHQHKLNNIFFY